MSALTSRARSTGQAIARGSAAGWLQLAVTVLAAPTYTALVIAALPREEASFWLVVLSLSAYFNLFDLGLGPTLTRFVAFAQSEKPEVAAFPRAGSGELTGVTAADLHTTAKRLYALLAVGLFALGLGLGPTILSSTTGLPVAGARLLAWAAFLVGCAAGILSTPYYAALAGFGVVGVPRLARAAAQIVGVGVAAIALVTAQGAVGVAVAWAAQNLLLLAAGPLVMRHFCPQLRARGRSRRDLARLLVRPSLRLAGIHVGGALILASGPLILAAYVGPTAVLQFVVVRQLAEAMYVLALVPAQVSEPFTARAAAAGDLGAVTALLRRNVRYVGVLLAIGAPVLAVLGREIVTAWVGAMNFAGYASLWLIVAVYVLEAHHVLHASTVMATGRVVFLRPALLAGAITVLIGVALAPASGVTGVIFGLFVAQLMTNNWYAPWYALRLLHIRVGSYLRWLAPVAPTASASAALALAARFVVLPAMLGNPSAVVWTLAALALATFPLAWYAALTPDERSSVGRAWRALMANR